MLAGDHRRAGGDFYHLCTIQTLLPSERRGDGVSGSIEGHRRLSTTLYMIA